MGRWGNPSCFIVCCLDLGKESAFRFCPQKKRRLRKTESRNVQQKWDENRGCGEKSCGAKAVYCQEERTVRRWGHCFEFSWAAVERKGMDISLSVVSGMRRSDIKWYIILRMEKHWARFALGGGGVAVTGGQKLDKHLPEEVELSLPQAGFWAAWPLLRGSFQPALLWWHWKKILHKNQLMCCLFSARKEMQVCPGGRAVK